MPSASTRIAEGGGTLTPDSYEIKNIFFHNNAGKIIDIKSFAQEIQLIEDLNSPFLEAILSLQDATNFFEEQKVTGDELVDIKIKRTPMDGTKEKISEFDLKFKIAEVFNFLRDGPSRQYYKFRLVSKHLYTNQARSLQRSFQGSIGKLVADICKKDLLIEKAINWLLRNAFDNGTPYFFYETLKDGIQFNSLENLYEKEIYETYDFLPYFKHDIGTTDAYNELRTRVKI